MGKDLTEIAVLLVGVALVALLVLNAGGTSAIIGTGTSGFANLLSTVEGNSGFGNMGAQMSTPMMGGMIP
jgi:hypothetical protein